MLIKRIIATVVVKNGWAVQSFGYQRYLPLGSPKCLVENLDRWGVDEILVLCIDRYACDAGPDFELLDQIGALGLSTPIIYAGGIRDAKDADKVLKSGADRICIDQLYYDNPTEVETIAEHLGVQAIILSIPMQIESGKLCRFNYLTKEIHPLKVEDLENKIDGISEILLIDHKSEGTPGAYDPNLVEMFPVELPIILYGGIWGVEKIATLFSHENVAAIAIGNPLNYQESTINNLRKELSSNNLREPYYSRDGIDIE